MSSLYECPKCGYEGGLETFEDTEYDGDVIATCPKCKVNTLILDATEVEEWANNYYLA